MQPCFFLPRGDTCTTSFLVLVLGASWQRGQWATLLRMFFIFISQTSDVPQHSSTTQSANTVDNPIDTRSLDEVIVVDSPNRWMWILFTSDEEVSNTGFTATWTFISSKFVIKTWNSNLEPATNQLPNTLRISTSRKRSLGQGNIFSSVSQKFCPQGVGIPVCLAAGLRGGLQVHTRGCIPACTEADPPVDGYCRGRHASYWNVFLFLSIFPQGALKSQMTFHLIDHKNSVTFSMRWLNRCSTGWSH